MLVCESPRLFVICKRHAVRIKQTAAILILRKCLEVNGLRFLSEIMRQRRRAIRKGHGHKVIKEDDKTKQNVLLSNVSEYRIVGCSSECAVAVILVMMTLVFLLWLLLYYGHFILCWLNVGMCTPLMDIVAMSYELSSGKERNESLAIDINGDISGIELCAEFITFDNPSTDFKLILLVTDSREHFTELPSNQILDGAVIFDDVVSPTENIDKVLESFGKWQKEHEDTLFIQVLSVEKVTEWLIDESLLHKLRCHQIGVMFLFPTRNSAEEASSIMNQIRFYKYGGIRNAVFYKEEMHRPNRIKMLMNFLYPDVSLQLVNDSMQDNMRDNFRAKH